MPDPLVPQYRQDRLSCRVVLVAANRAERPIQVASPATESENQYDPFLEGNEHDTPLERLALRNIESKANEPGWLLRVVPNRYPAVTQLSSEALASRPDESASPAAHGIHEVVIECPDGRSRLANLSVTELARVLMAWQRRVVSLSREPGIETIHVFRNEGSMAGASLPHCHSQIIATEEHTQRQRVHDVTHAEFGALCCYREWLKDELEACTRVVKTQEDLVVVCPFASRVAWHVRLCPNVALHQQSVPFGKLSEKFMRKLAAALLSIVDALHDIHGPVAFNLLLTMPPVSTPRAYPWMLDLMPRTSQFAGFELLTDIDIITTAPESAADRLRRSVNWLSPPPIDESLWPNGYGWI